MDGNERPRGFEVDADGPCHLHGVLDLVAMSDELAEAPRSDIELFPGQLLEEVQHVGGGGTVCLSEVFGGGHSCVFG